METSSKLALIAIGGNSLIPDERHRSVPDQYHAVEETVRHVAALLRRGYRIVLTHGNGPRSARSSAAREP